MNIRKLCAIELFNNYKNSKLCKIKIKSESLLPLAKHIKDSIWAISSQKDITLRVNCEAKGTSVNKIIHVKSPLDMIKLDPNCVARSDEMELPRFYEFATVKKLETSKNIKFNHFELSIWKPFELKFGNEFGNWDLRNLDDLKEIDMESLIQTMNSIKPVNLKPIKVGDFIWAIVLGIILVVGISILFIFIRKRKFMLARLLSGHEGSRPVPGSEAEEVGLQEASQITPPTGTTDSTLTANKSQPNTVPEEINPSYNIYPQV